MNESDTKLKLGTSLLTAPFLHAVVTVF